jgi:hypothetical protein
MLQIINKKVQVHRMLRCLWVPSHTGVNAPLRAVWIETEADMEKEEAEAVSVDEPLILLRAA